MKILAIIIGILIGAGALCAILYALLWLVVKPGREAAERNKDIYRERYISSKKQ